MKSRIRSITIGIDIDEVYENQEAIEQLITVLKKSLVSAGHPVDTTRIVFNPFITSRSDDVAALLPKLDSCDKIATTLDIRWMCLPVRITDAATQSEMWSFFSKLLSRYPKLFLHFMADDSLGVASNVLVSVAKTIIDISRLSNNGYDNFRVGCGCNIRANTPFFPFSYHNGNKGFSIATDIIGSFVEVSENNPALIDASELIKLLSNSVIDDLLAIESIAKSTKSKFNTFEYKGMDCSLAPYPRGKRSVAYLLEKIGPHLCGDCGTLSATALLTKAIRMAIAQANVSYSGFNGVMFSPLEDSYLARNMGRHMNIEKLMLYSTVCGCGIDMVPLAGTVSANELAALIQDVMVLSTIHKKPLGVRVLPIPNKMANEITDFNHDFLENCRVQDISGYGLLNGKILNNGEIL